MDDPALRDLIWAVGCPSLLVPPTGWPGLFDDLVTDAAVTRLKQLDAGGLEAHLAGRDTRLLGTYFEALWEYFFITDPDFELVAKGLQVRDAGRTIGEFDFIVFDRRTDRHIHVELAIKFFLGIELENSLPYTNGRHLWVGPQTRDRLDRKVGRTLEHQLRLGEHPAARQCLAGLGVTSVEARMSFKGRLFQPATALELPDYVRGNGHGQWLRISALSTALDGDGPWYVLQKRHWLHPPYAENAATPLDSRELLAELTGRFGARSGPVMVVQCDDTSAGASVLKRYFVTPDAWPGRVRA